MSKTKLKVLQNTWKYWRDETDDRIGNQFGLHCIKNNKNPFVIDNSFETQFQETLSLKPFGNPQEILNKLFRNPFQTL